MPKRMYKFESAPQPQTEQPVGGTYSKQAQKRLEEKLKSAPEGGGSDGTYSKDAEARVKKMLATAPEAGGSDGIYSAGAEERVKKALANAPLPKTEITSKSPSEIIDEAVGLPLDKAMRTEASVKELAEAHKAASKAERARADRAETDIRARIAEVDKERDADRLSPESAAFVSAQKALSRIQKEAEKYGLTKTQLDELVAKGPVDTTRSRFDGMKNFFKRLSGDSLAGKVPAEVINKWVETTSKANATITSVETGKTSFEDTSNIGALLKKYKVTLPEGMTVAKNGKLEYVQTGKNAINSENVVADDAYLRTAYDMIKAQNPADAKAFASLVGTERFASKGSTRATETPSKGRAVAGGRAQSTQGFYGMPGSTRRAGGGSMNAELEGLLNKQDETLASADLAAENSESINHYQDQIIAQKNAVETRQRAEAYEGERAAKEAFNLGEKTAYLAQMDPGAAAEIMGALTGGKSPEATKDMATKAAGEFSKLAEEMLKLQAYSRSRSLSQNETKWLHTLESRMGKVTNLVGAYHAKTYGDSLAQSDGESAKALREQRLAQEAEKAKAAAEKAARAKPMLDILEESKMGAEVAGATMRAAEAAEKESDRIIQNELNESAMRQVAAQGRRNMETRAKISREDELKAIDEQEEAAQKTASTTSRATPKKPQAVPSRIKKTGT